MVAGCVVVVVLGAALVEVVLGGLDVVVLGGAVVVVEDAGGPAAGALVDDVDVETVARALGPVAGAAATGLSASRAGFAATGRAAVAPTSGLAQ